MLTCKTCSVEKEESCFYLQQGRRNRNCKNCVTTRAREQRKNRVGFDAVSRKQALKRLYGITPDDYDLLLSAQENVCAVCHKPSFDGRRLHVDHDHVTGKVRGLLCHKCNSGIGSFRDERRLLLKASDYLLSFEKEREAKLWEIRAGKAVAHGTKHKRRYSWGEKI